MSIYPELGAISAVDITVPTPDGGVPGRLYRAPGEALAGFVWVHGGAFIAGDLDMPEAHWVSLYLASHGISVLSLDYRKALHGLKYPAPSNDVRAGWLWATENLSELGLATADDLHLGGASAGAALTAALTARLGDDAGQMPASLLLAYPLVHAKLPPLSEEIVKKMEGVPSDLVFGPDFIRDINLNFAGSEDIFSDPHAFAGSGDLNGFPPVYIINSEADTLRASGELFAAQLESAGVHVRIEMEPGSMHGHLDHPHSVPARNSVERMRRWLHNDRRLGLGPIVGTIQN
ncbi:alpha/beta hydrolase [Pseudarthrobacter sulfonivorans]|uniref:alpha/beta hydrolase n=1 Tax=Pseudarthrobacter sulfonivorans TaxID=121292 RepID=UPI0012FD783A|nr:alpha/beta hydrolase [Pseudarthrobacter sulfonivorans]